MLQVQPHQGAQIAALAQQVLHHAVRALVRRAQHQQAGAVAGHQCVHHWPAPVDAGPHHQAAHAVRQQADGLRGLLLQAGQQLAQPVAQGVQRQAPVIGEGHHPVRRRQVPAQRAVGHVEHRVGLDAAAVPGQLVQPAGSDAQRVQPDAAVARHRQVRPHDAGQQHHHRPVGIGHTTRHDAQGVQAVKLAGQGLEGRHVARIGAGQPVAQRRAGVQIAEVVEVRHLGTAVEQHPGLGLRRDAAEHGAGVHHQVVVDLVKQQKVGQQHAQAHQQVAALDVACDQAQLHAGPHRAARQQGGHRRVGQHAFDARHQVRVGAALGDLDHHPLEGRVKRVAKEVGHRADQRQQARQEDIHIAAGQLGALGRAGHPQVALHLGLALAQQRGQGAQVLTLLGVGVAQLRRYGSVGKLIVVAVDLRLQIGQAQQVAHQAAA